MVFDGATNEFVQVERAALELDLVTRDASDVE